MEELIYVSPEMQTRAEEFLDWWLNIVKGSRLTGDQYERILERMK